MIKDFKIGGNCMSTSLHLLPSITHTVIRIIAVRKYANFSQKMHILGFLYISEKIPIIG